VPLLNDLMNGREAEFVWNIFLSDENYAFGGLAGVACLPTPLSTFRIGCIFICHMHVNAPLMDMPYYLMKK
jgi:hypothetical protein